MVIPVTGRFCISDPLHPDAHKFFGLFDPLDEAKHTLAAFYCYGQTPTGVLPYFPTLGDPTWSVDNVLAYWYVNRTAAGCPNAPSTPTFKPNLLLLTPP